MDDNNNIEQPVQEKKKSLFDLMEEYFETLSEVSNNEGELTEELEKMLDLNQKNLESKLDAIADFKEHLENDNELYKSRIAFNQSRIKSNELKIEKLKQLVLIATIQFGKTGKSLNKVIDTPNHKFYTTNRKSLVIPPTYVEPKYTIVSKVFKFDKEILLNDSDEHTAVLEALDTLHEYYKDSSEILDKTLIKADIESNNLKTSFEYKTANDFEIQEEYDEYLKLELEHIENQPKLELKPSITIK